MPLPGNDGTGLLFLVSQPRAGSTLLQRILSTHSSIHTGPEPWLLLHLLGGVRPEGTTAPWNSAAAARSTGRFLETLEAGEEAYWEGARRMALHVYGEALKDSGKSVFLDKTPRYHHVLPEIRRLFPAARMVVLLRNPLAVFSSILETWAGYHESGLQRYRFDLVDAPGRLLAALEVEPRPFRVRYEDVVATPRATVGRLCAYLDLPFEEGMIEYGRRGREERWSSGDQRLLYDRDAPDPSRAERWRESLAGNRTWAAWAGEYLDMLGEETVEGMGYDFRELREAVRPLTGDTPDHVPLPTALGAGPGSAEAGSALFRASAAVRRAFRRARRSVRKRGLIGTARHLVLRTRS